MKAPTLAGLWAEYCDNFLPPRTDPDFRDVLAMAFYSGAVSFAVTLPKASELPPVIRRRIWRKIRAAMQALEALEAHYPPRRPIKRPSPND